MTAKDPAGRPATPGEVAEALGPFAAGSNLLPLLVRAQTRQVSPAAARESSASVDTHPSAVQTNEALRGTPVRPKPEGKPAVEKAFDAYHKWLSIPPEEQPPHHYRLLGIKPFETDPDVIEGAADRQMAHLRNYQAGKHSELSQKLLNEVSAARVCLLNPGKRAAYDRQLRKELKAKQRAIPRAVPLDTPEVSKAEGVRPAEPVPTVDIHASVPAAPRGKLAKRWAAARRWSAARPWAGPVIGAAVGLAAIGAVLVFGTIIVRISRNGQTTTVEAPDSSRVVVRPDGSVQVDGKSRPQPPQPHRKPPISESSSSPSAAAPKPLYLEAGAPPLAIAPFDAAQARKHQEAWAKFLGVPVERTNSIGMKLVLIPPGEFEMGATKEELDGMVEEVKQTFSTPTTLIYAMEMVHSRGPRHHVRITKPLYLGTCEVTQREFERVMGDNPSTFHGAPDLPVNNVTWNETVEFCRKLSEMPREKAAGATYGLPTEAQWEYACRAGTTTRFPSVTTRQS